MAPEGTNECRIPAPQVDMRMGRAPAFRTRSVHAGENESRSVRPLVEPIHLSCVYAFRDPALADQRRDADPSEPLYSRDGLPNVLALERAVADLEGAEAAHAVASGMAAIAMVFLAHLSSGDEVIVAADCYCDTEALLSHQLARFGVRSAFVDLTDPAALATAITPQTRLIYVETISNPGMVLADLPELAAVTRARGVILCVDNTFATPALCRPLEHGADLVVHSATKFLGGHHDLTAGVVAGRRELIEPVRRCGYLFGPTLGPMDAWLALRGIKTLALRMEWISESATAVAAFLSHHPVVRDVRYPGLLRQPRMALVRRLLPNGAGGMLSFDLAGGPLAADTFIRNLSMIPYAPSLGGTSTTICYPPRRDRFDGSDSASPRNGTLRLSVGLEAVRDIIADLAQALDRLSLAGTDDPATGVAP